MLICPQCQFENPNTNKFCQRCGTSLTHKLCAECGTNVALSEKECHKCGVLTGTVWWAIISRDQDSKQGDKEDKGTRGQGENLVEIPPIPSQSPQRGEPPQLVRSPSSYLDPEQRYKLLEPLPPPNEVAASTEMEVRVLDCQPLEPTPLQAGADSEIGIEMPAVALTYLALQSQTDKTFPAIHDAWQQSGQQVVLIADRSDWSKLIYLWEDDETTSPVIFQCLDKMTQLWAELEPLHCRQSLLELENLRVDKNGVLGLQRLYTEPEAGKPLTLQDLGLVWQSLFQESQRTQFGLLAELLTDLKAGNVRTTDDLRSRLEAIANELQVNFTSTPDQEGEAGEAQGTGEELQTDSLGEQSPERTPSAPPAPPALLDELPTIVPPMQLFDLKDAGRTDTGRQRHHNEDFFAIETEINKLEFPNGRTVFARGLYILCDGMGGHAKGEEASNLAVNKLQEYFKIHWQSQELPSEDSIRSAVRLANQAIYDMNQQSASSGIGRMGTTLVMVLLSNTQVAVAHVGDSRLYRLSRKRGLERVTMDHEVGQREILRGVEPEIAYARPDAYQLTQALGPRDENFVNPDVQFLELNEDTLLILASDGLSDNDLLENHWHTHLEPLLSSRTSLEHGVSELIDLANKYNGHDNITVVLLRAKLRPHEEGSGVSDPFLLWSR